MAKRKKTSGFGYTEKTCKSDKFIVDFGLFSKRIM